MDSARKQGGPGLAAIAISQEDRDVESARRFLEHFDETRSFDIVFDIDRAATKRYHRTTTYLIDERGVVRQVFPSLIHHRPAWSTVLEEVERLSAAAK